MRPALLTDRDAFVCEWLRHLVSAGHLNGEVVVADVWDLRPDQLAGRDAHLFAGIGGWPLALRRAGWPEGFGTWTGSCPCQPFSTAGKKKGQRDERHLWPVMRDLVAEHRPAVVFGEQVASPAGRSWLDAVSTDLETLGYAVGAADLCAAGVGAPHKRQRLFWVALADRERLEGVRLQLSQGRSEQDVPQAPGRGQVGGLADAERGGPARDPAAGDDRQVGDWSRVEWLECADDRFRPVEPGLEPLVDGVPARVGRLRAFGNAIVPELAAVFVRSVMDVLSDPGGNLLSCTI